ncbi:hypothetical protein ACH5RR_023444 [Cinchona calisaya]|uniref:Uncharacterized protein n=1 Tax=Cinchona calisaya TaxID=153742 RepID=A0ABD2ZEL8_9GENT
MRSSLRSTNSISSNFFTPASSPVSHVGNDIIVQPQTSESHASENNDDIQTFEEQKMHLESIQMFELQVVTNSYQEVPVTDLY